ncbi:MAG: ATP-binding protein [Chitinispirillia bacterium]|nr:ATP-binding protein [Chitinispirillia bacterium]MCL2241927.1 ATP-binding protein [Chitinispirillia bacterium]
MSNKMNALILTAAILALAAVAVFAINNGPFQKTSAESMRYTSYLDVPGVTPGDIEAVERLKKQHRAFIYGMTPSTELFTDCETGELKGYAVLFAGWLTDLFGIPFNPVVYEQGALTAGLEDGSVHFTGDLMPTVERRAKYSMTSDPIARRTLNYFKLMDSLHPLVITATRAPRFAFLNGAATYSYVVSSGVYDTLEAMFINSVPEAYGLLKSGKIDAFLEESVLETAFDTCGDVTSVKFFPLLYNPISMSASVKELEPIISIVQKALQNGGGRRLAGMYGNGEHEYRKHKFCMALTGEERDYIRDNPVIPFAAEHYNYPIAFYNKYEKGWQGIFFDVLERTTELTGLNFKRVNNQYAEWPELFKLVESGEAYMVAELIPSEDRRAKGFLWPVVPTTEDNYALLSKSETPDVTLEGVLEAKVGLTRGTAYTEVFHTWFPNHPNTVEYESSDEAFAALNRGEIDMVMSSQRRLLAITNYHEYRGYKANFVFDRTSESFIGFNREQPVLASIIGKALLTIDIRSISEQWELKTYDYKGKIAQAQRPWLIGAAVLLLVVLILVTFLLQIKRGEGKRLEVLVQKRTSEAQAANRAKSAFLANMSHEIRTPLNAIIGMTAICKNTRDIWQKDHAIDKIEHASEYLLGLVNDVLDMSKIEADKLELTPVEYDFGKILRKITAVIKFRIEEKRQDLQINIDENIPRNLIGDDQRLTQVIMNLLSNAVKFTPNEGEIRLDAMLAGETDDYCELRIEVSDNGIGIPLEQQDRLFNAFEQADTNTSRKFGGTGLGLSISKRIIELMDGRIWVESEVGKGSRFIAVVKSKKGSGGPVEEQTRTLPSLRDGEFAGRRMLLVEDIDSNRYVVISLLKNTDMEVDIAENGKEAVEMVTANPAYDLILMDLEMPVMDGYEATRRIRALPAQQDKKLPIVAMTANVFKEDIAACLEAGMDDHIGKPLDVNDLFARLRKHLG